MWARQQGTMAKDDFLLLDLWGVLEDESILSIKDESRSFYTVYGLCTLLLKASRHQQRPIDE